MILSFLLLWVAALLSTTGKLSRSNFNSTESYFFFDRKLLFLVSLVSLIKWILFIALVVVLLPAAVVVLSNYIESLLLLSSLVYLIFYLSWALIYKIDGLNLLEQISD